MHHALCAKQKGAAMPRGRPKKKKEGIEEIVKRAEETQAEELGGGICVAGETLTAQQKEALEWVEKATQTESPGLQIEYLSKATKTDGSRELQIEYLSKAIELNPQNALAYFCRGVTYSNLRQYRKAMDDYTKTIELNPLHANAYYYRGITYGILGENQKATDKAMEMNPGFAGAYYNRGVSGTCKKYFTAACDDFYQAGLLYLKENKKTEALKCVDLIKQTDSSSPLIKKLMDKINEEPK
jgi:tetratricopeptide (TPR) repeat protein